MVRKESSNNSTYAYVRAGPHESLHFDPNTVNAAIVTCGGLCPGLNNVIREVTNTLHNLYNINGKVYGILGGFKGFHDIEPMVLTPSVVENIHHQGGTFLGSSRGGFDIDKIINFLERYEVNQLYVIGGDGTHRGAFAIHEECIKRGKNIAVAGIPKTIDNDIDYIDRSFGFTSAVEAAQAAIRTAKTEARCNLPKAGENRYFDAVPGPSCGGSDAHGKVAIAKLKLHKNLHEPTNLYEKNYLLLNSSKALLSTTFSSSNSSLSR